MTVSHPWRPRGRSSAFLTLALMAFGVLVAALIGEVAVRIFGLKGQEAGRIFRIADGQDLQFPGRASHHIIDLYGSNPRGSFPIDLNDEATRARLIAEKFTRIDEARATNPYGVPFSYNARGFRDREFTVKEPGRRRVVFVGDSFTEAQGVVEPLTAVRLVETALRKTDPHLEIWNLGVRGQDFPDLEGLFETALELSPDALIFGMVLNDADRDPELTRNWPRVNDWIMVRQDERSWIARHSQLVDFVTHRYEQLSVSRETTAWYSALYSDQNKAGWMRTRAALMRIQAECRTRGIGFGVALWPLLVGLESGGAYPFEAAHAQIKKGVERSGIPFVDLLPTLRGRDSRSLWVHTSDLHPNEIAQALVAPVLADFAGKRLQEASDAQSVAK
ncbi:MAG: GDSL-type esterase/lipase family protein [Vicinamibacteria bacterium]